MESASSMGDWKADLVELAAGLQMFHSSEFIRCPVPSPRFILIGGQSFGKTRTLSCIAGCKLGGAEQASTGTRCPVEYMFRFEKREDLYFEVGTERSSLAPVQQAGVSEFLTQHMKTLEDQESASGTGFSTEPVFVTIAGPKVPSFTIVDLPGLKKGTDPASKRCNDCILDMYSGFYKLQYTVPIILTMFDGTMDMDQIADGVKSFIEKAKLPTGLCKQALLFVSRMDVFAKFLDHKDLRKYLDALKGTGIDRRRVILGTLRPDMFGETEHEQPDSDEYFQYYRAKFEEERFHPLVEKKGLQNLGCSLGFNRLKAALQDDLVRCLKDNKVMDFLLQQLQEACQNGDSLLHKCEPLTTEVMNSEIPAYVSLFAAALAGAASNDVLCRIQDNVKDLRRRHPSFFQADKTEKTLAADIVEATRATFEEETSRMRDAGSWLSLPPNQGDGALDRDLHLGGSAAIRRLVKIVGYALITKSLDEYDAEKITYLQSGNVSLSHTVAQDYTGVVRKMVQECQPSSQDFEDICNWCISIYAEQADGIQSAFRKNINLLDNNALRDLIDELIIEQYRRKLRALANAVKERMDNASEARFKILDLDGILINHVIVDLALGSFLSNGCIQVGNQASTQIKELVQGCAKKGTQVRDWATLALDIVVEPEVSVHPCKEQSKDKEKSTKVENLNKIANAVAKSHLCHLWQDMKGAVGEHLEAKVTQIPHDIPNALSAIPRLLATSKGQLLLEQLAQSPEEAEKQVRKARELARHLNDLCASITEFKRVMGSNPHGSDTKVGSAMVLAEKLQQVNEVHNATRREDGSRPRVHELKAWLKQALELQNGDDGGKAKRFPSSPSIANSDGSTMPSSQGEQ